VCVLLFHEGGGEMSIESTDKQADKLEKGLDAELNELFGKIEERLKNEPSLSSHLGFKSSIEDLQEELKALRKKTPQ
jgi:hypothetical protein